MKTTRVVLALSAVMIMSNGAYALQSWSAVGQWAPVNAPQNAADVWTYRMGDWPDATTPVAPGTLMDYANPAGDGALPGYQAAPQNQAGWVVNPGGGTFTTWIAEVRWLSPITGPVTVSGLLQAEYATFDRYRDWVLLKNGVALQTYVNPDNLTPYSVDVSVVAGDTLAMRMVKTPSGTGPYYNHLSMDVNERENPIPEPATLALLACGCGGLMMIRRKRS